jgi:uncharacterized iron-regulated membrane protein
MAISTRGRLRKAWFYVHMWIGVGLSLVLIPICLTGAYEVWHEEIDRVINGQRYQVSSSDVQSPSAYLSAAQAAFGDRALTANLRLPEKPGDPVIVTGPIRRSDAASPSGGGAQRPPPRRQPTLTAWIDPGTARVLDVADTSREFRQWIHRIHGSLLIPEVGRKVVGWLGWALFASCATGLWLWWPRGAFAKGFRWKRTPDTLLNLHYLTGFWVALPLGVLALTGVFISFPQTTRAVLSNVAPVSAQQPRGPGGGGTSATRPAISPEAAARSALALAPGGELRSLSLPTSGREALWRAQIDQDGKEVSVTVDDRLGTAKLTSARPVAAGDAALRWNRRLHDGSDMGLVWRVVITAAGIVPALLGVTGVIVWAGRELRKARMRRRFKIGAEGAAAPAE